MFLLYNVEYKNVDLKQNIFELDFLKLYIFQIRLIKNIFLLKTIESSIYFFFGKHESEDLKKTFQ